MKFIANFLETHEKRILGLDILRSIAILLVVGSHSVYFLSESARKLYFSILPISIDGVSIFFVLSGFLIGGILLKIIENTEFNKIDLLNFWIRRWFRTIPNYVFVLILVVSIKVLLHKPINFFSISYFFFLQNAYTPHPSFFREAWSLTVEEWFYLLFPIAIYFSVQLVKNKSKAIFISTLLFLIIPLVFRVIKFKLGLGLHDFDEEYRKIMVFRLDNIMYGVLGAIIYYKYNSLWYNKRYIYLSIGVLFLILFKFNFFNWIDIYKPIEFNIESIIILLFLPFLSTLKTTKLKYFNAFIIFISIISYSMYLLNFSLIGIMIMPPLYNYFSKYMLFRENFYIMNFFLFWFLTIFCSAILYKVYENPMTNLRSKFRIN